MCALEGSTRHTRSRVRMWGARVTSLVRIAARWPALRLPPGRHSSCGVAGGVADPAAPPPWQAGTLLHADLSLPRNAGLLTGFISGKDAQSPATAAGLLDLLQQLAPSLDAMHDAGLFRLLLPRSIGGLELRPAEYVQCIEAVAMGDASVAWCMNQGSGCSMTAARHRCRRNQRSSR